SRTRKQAACRTVAETGCFGCLREGTGGPIFRNSQGSSRPMTAQTSGAIDCDIHPAVPGLKALLPYLPDHWRDAVVQRGVHELDSISYPLNSPLSARPD